MDVSSSSDAPSTPPLALEQLLISMGCPTEKSPILASQMWKRSFQLSQQTGRPQEEALTHLLQLVKNGMKNSGPPVS